MAGLLLPATAYAQPPRAPPQACQAKFDSIGAGAGANLASDLQWLKDWCDPALHDRAVDLVAAGTVDSAMEEARAAAGEGAAEATSAMAEAHAAANASSDAAMLATLGSGPTVVVAPTRTIVVSRPLVVVPPPR